MTPRRVEPARAMARPVPLLTRSYSETTSRMMRRARGLTRALTRFLKKARQPHRLLTCEPLPRAEGLGKKRRRFAQHGVRGEGESGSAARAAQFLEAAWGCDSSGRVSHHAPSRITWSARGVWFRSCRPGPDLSGRARLDSPGGDGRALVPRAALEQGHHDIRGVILEDHSWSVLSGSVASISATTSASCASQSLISVALCFLP